MSETKPQSDSATNNTLTGLAHAIKNVDRDADTRKCPHECHGTLQLTDDDRVICPSCRCTPDGVYLPPDDHGDNSGQDSQCMQFAFFVGKRKIGPLSSDSYPKGERPQSPSNGREYYSQSNKPILPGGHERVYDEDDTNRPNWVGDEYTFDLSTL